MLEKQKALTNRKELNNKERERIITALTIFK